MVVEDPSLNPKPESSMVGERAHTDDEFLGISDMG